jgi:hypothetical protein
MRIINNILFYSENELQGKTFDHEDIQKNIPKGKYYDVRKIEDSAYSITYRTIRNGQEQPITRKFITMPNLKNRATRRANERASNKKGYTLETLHKRFKKRRAKKKFNKG